MKTRISTKSAKSTGAADANTRTATRRLASRSQKRSLKTAVRHIIAEPGPARAHNPVVTLEACVEAASSTGCLAPNSHTTYVTAPEPRPEGRDSYSVYLNEIGQTPLLTPSQEIDVARKVRKGDPEARDLMIRSNLRLVVKIARDYEHMGMPLLDLINEGNIGLMQAVDRFDPERGAKFSTYAAWWIKLGIKRSLSEHSRTIRLPSTMVQRIFNLRKASARLEEELGREPTDEELAEELDVNLGSVRLYRKSAEVRSTSLDAPLGSEADSDRLSDVLADEKTQTPYRETERDDNVAVVQQLMKGLDPKERAILERRFGLDGDEERTLEDIGETFGVTRERIRQIQELALAKLRHRMRKFEPEPALN